MIKKVVCIQQDKENLLTVNQVYNVYAIYSCACTTDNIHYDIGRKGEFTGCLCPLCKTLLPTTNYEETANANLFADLDEWQEAGELVNELMEGVKEKV